MCNASGRHRHELSFTFSRQFTELQSVRFNASLLMQQHWLDYRHCVPDTAIVAHKLNVAAVLEGRVRRSAHTIRITVQLARPPDEQA
jgi:TolB-like protein